MAEFEFVTTFDLASRGVVSLPSQSDEPAEQAPPTRRRGSFASFVCHLSYLDTKLRGFTSLVLDGSVKIQKTSRILGRGTTFLVSQAAWAKDPNHPPLDVALKEIVPDTILASHLTSDWKDILFEIRALLHEPLKYHPNLVRLLGLQWGLSSLSESTYPMLVMECSTLGSLKHLQQSTKPLPFPTKQKLCHDIARGLSALHACGIVHGDMKHENVLIYFNNQDAQHGVPYTAKLADFGGSVMDMSTDDFRRLETWTWPFQAPEWSKPLSREGMKLTDVYSFGLLIWRAFTDGQGFISLPGASQESSDEDKRNLISQKDRNNFTNIAIADVCKYGTTHKIPQPSIDLIIYTILCTVRLNPTDRSLAKTQAALRGTKLGRIEALLDLVRVENDESEAERARRPPGQHGITRDSLRFMLGRYGQSVDLQDNLPGYRPRIDEPSAGEFLFEPEKLKGILTWEQQQQIVQELKEAAERAPGTPGDLLNLKKTVASFYLFQCHLLEFGVQFNAPDAIEWLRQAASDDDSYEDADYLSQAWLWRISQAFGVELDLSSTKLQSLLQLAVFRGHRTALEDLGALASGNLVQNNESWKEIYWRARGLLHDYMGAVGMGYFFPPRMTNPFDLIDIVKLDQKIRLQLQEKYDQSLRLPGNSSDPTGDRHRDNSTDPRREAAYLDKIYVNARGHGLLHFAAAIGNIKTLRYLVSKYKCNIDLPNQHVDETPLLCACAGGKLHAALYLLEQGADPNGYRFSQESPLHWLCSYLTPDMEVIASKLVSSGADIELHGGGMRHDVRDIRADWEHNFEIPVTPLGRAVLFKSLDAVKVLLKFGADPLARTGIRHQGQISGLENMRKDLDVSCPLELAAVLTLPEILQEMLLYIDGMQKGPSQPPVKILDEMSMLDLAHNKKITKFDPLTLQSRLVRCGTKYQNNLRLTLQILFQRARPWSQNRDGEELTQERSKVLCKEISLGNVDIVECLLDLGYPVDGTKGFQPIDQAIYLNHEGMFQTLVKHKANLKSIRTISDGSQFSLLHLCASRPKQSRPGRAIVDHLIAAGLPLETSDGKTKSPMVLAILCQNYDVAQALLENGANINATYQLQYQGLDEPEVRAVTILAELLTQHTARSLESLRFLLGKKEGGPRQRPDFIVDKEKRLCVFHILAECRQFTEMAQITPQILTLCVQAYHEPSCINYVHPTLGSAIYNAATTGNLGVVSLLLSKGVDVTSAAGPDVATSVQLLLRAKETWTPLWAAILRYDEEIRKLVSFPRSDPLDSKPESRLLANLESIVAKLLQRDADEVARQAWETLVQKKALLMKTYRDAMHEKAKEREGYQAAENEYPIELWTEPGKEASKVDQEVVKLPEKTWITDDLLQYLDGFKQG